MQQQYNTTTTLKMKQREPATSRPSIHERKRDDRVTIIDNSIAQPCYTASQVTPRNTITLGDARKLSSSIEDNSIDLIFTDPPYTKKDIYLYGWLAKEAARVLKPGSLCISYVGNYFLAEAVSLLSQHLTYYWQFVNIHSGANPYVWDRQVFAAYKPLLVFSKERARKHKRCFDAKVGNQDKKYHIWGQGEATASYFIDCLSSPGDIIWDPFTGGGTIPAVCKQIGRSFIAYEIDPDVIQIARARLEVVQPLLMSQEVYEQSPLMEKEAEVAS